MSTLIWAAPRLQSEVAELKIVGIICVCGYHFWGVVLVWISYVFFPPFHRFQISCVPNTAKSMESYAGQTRLEQLMIGYDETCLFRGGGHKIELVVLCAWANITVTINNTITIAHSWIR